VDDILALLDEFDALQLSLLVVEDTTTEKYGPWLHATTHVLKKMN
jgi:hypothetical protein